MWWFIGIGAYVAVVFLTLALCRAAGIADDANECELSGKPPAGRDGAPPTRPPAAGVSQNLEPMAEQ